MQITKTDVLYSAKRSRYLALGALVGIVAFSGYNWVVMKVAINYAEPAAFAAMRTFLAAVSLLAVMVVLKRPLRPKVLPITVAFGLLQTAAATGLGIWALKYAGAGKTSVLTFTMPFWLLIIAWIVLGERLRGLQWVTIILAFGGLIFILSPWELRGGVLGDVMAIGSGISLAASAVVAKLLHAKHDLDVLSLTAWQMLFGSIALVIVAAFTTSRPPVWSGSFIAALLYSVLMSGALTTYLWFFVLQVLPAGTAGISTLGTPVAGTFLAWLQLGERPAFWEGLGMLLIIAALAALALITGRDLPSVRRGNRP